MDDTPREPGDLPPRWAFETMAAHAGLSSLRAGERGPDVMPTVPTVKPVYESTAFGAASMDELDRVFAGDQAGYVYTRYANPTVVELERVVGALEGGEPDNAVAFGSGMGAMYSAMLAVGLSAGDSVVASRDLYGQTYTLLNGQMRRFGVETMFVDTTNIDEATEAIARTRPRLVVMETVSNPLLRVSLIELIAEAAHGAAALVLVDNTFATPYLVRPLECGADIVAHSATKFLSGHGDTMGGVAVARTRELAGALRSARKDTGAVLSPHDAWLITRGVRTLPLRLQRQCENAAQVAEWLTRHPAIARVSYPGLDPWPLKTLYGAELGGSMVSFVIRGAGKEKVFAFIDSLRLIFPAPTLGDLSTLVLYPAISSHRSLTPEARQAVGISDGLVRLSIGVESVVDIINDLEKALWAAGER